jgi:hypothetical protein
MRALIAAAAGLAGLALSEPLERAVLGRRPAYHPTVMLRRMGWAAPLSVAWLLRAGYGLSLGAAAAMARRRLPRSTLLAGVAVGAGVFAGERWALPALGATPPLRDWPARERALLLLHTLAFGSCAVAALDGFATTRR